MGCTVRRDHVLRNVALYSTLVFFISARFRARGCTVMEKPLLSGPPKPRSDPCNDHKVGGLDNLPSIKLRARKASRVVSW